jgi:hypothetical protein
MSKVIFIKASKGFWNRNLREYYLERRKISATILRLIKNRVVADIPALSQAVNIDTLKWANKWRRILADFGEVAASWFLETHESVYLVKLRWIDFPLRIMDGIDLLGYKPASRDLAVAEAKVSSATSLSSTVGRLSDQLSRSRIDAELNSPLNEYGSKAWLAEELVEKGIIPEDRVEEILSETRYLRYGFLFHPDAEPAPKYSQLVTSLETEGLPVTFVDYTLESLQHEVSSFVEVLVVNKELMKNAKTD